LHNEARVLGFTHRFPWAVLELAKAAGVHIRQIARQEAGDQQPALPVAVQLADALGISIAQLAGKVSYELDLRGESWCEWQTWKDGEPRIDTHTMEVHQRGELVQLDADRARPLEEGSYRWRGELRLWDNEAMIGWYRSADGRGPAGTPSGPSSSWPGDESQPQ
jgi:transcriptional regulator with XRE-family HTH domain